VDLQHIPAIDVHAHPFGAETRQLTVQQLRDGIAVSLRGPTGPVNETMLLAKLMVLELARFLDCEPTFEAVVVARNAAAEHDYPGYIAALFRDANIETLLVDHGFPADPELPFEPFANLLPRRPIQGYRIERFFSHGSFHGTSPQRSFDDVLTELGERMEAAIRDEGARFFKSIMAYRTGLAIRPTSLDTAREAWAQHRAYGDSAEKVIRDYLFVFTAEKAKEFGVPFQLHTGHTSHANIWPDTNPILLTPILNSGLVDGARLVLVHGGYPYCTEGGYLTSVYPDVFLDLSLMIPWASAGVARRIHQTLESAPISKVMYGSDGIICPEMHWIAAILGRRALGTVLDELVRDGFLTRADAEEAAQDILHRNARNVYGIASL
jgi:uncharacterized protein